MGAMNFRLASALVMAISTTWIFHGLSAAEETSATSPEASEHQESGFDPWAAPTQRWPDVLSPGLGEEETYYYWTREDSKSLLRKGTEREPLHVWVGGDSMAGGAALGFRELTRRENRWDFTEDVRKSTGIVSDWYFDWESHLKNEIADGPYEVVVLSIGGNDWQGFRGGPTEKGSVEWLEKYRSRISRMLKTLDRPGRLVIWVGMPHFRIPFMVPLPDVVNPITRNVFENGERSSWIDAAAIVSPGGVWVKHVTDENGKIIEVRTDDGTHYQSDGARLLAAAVVKAIEERTG